MAVRHYRLHLFEAIELVGGDDQGCGQRTRIVRGQLIALGVVLRDREADIGVCRLHAIDRKSDAACVVP